MEKQRKAPMRVGFGNETTTQSNDEGCGDFEVRFPHAPSCFTSFLSTYQFSDQTALISPRGSNKVITLPNGKTGEAAETA